MWLDMNRFHYVNIKSSEKLTAASCLLLRRWELPGLLSLDPLLMGVVGLLCLSWAKQVRTFFVELEAPRNGKRIWTRWQDVCDVLQNPHFVSWKKHPCRTFGDVHRVVSFQHYSFAPSHWDILLCCDAGRFFLPLPGKKKISWSHGVFCAKIASTWGRYFIVMFWISSYVWKLISCSAYVLLIQHPAWAQTLLGFLGQTLFLFAAGLRNVSRFAWACDQKKNIKGDVEMFWTYLDITFFGWLFEILPPMVVLEHLLFAQLVFPLDRSCRSSSSSANRCIGTEFVSSFSFNLDISFRSEPLRPELV